MAANALDGPTREPGLFLDRRTVPRVELRCTARFAPDASRPLRIGHGLVQDISTRGVRILSTVLLDPLQTFPIWIAVKGKDVVSANARVSWMRVEDMLGDSPYWIATGLRLSFTRPSDQEIISEIVASRTNLTKGGVGQQVDSKIGYVF